MSEVICECCGREDDCIPRMLCTACHKNLTGIAECCGKAQALKAENAKLLNRNKELVNQNKELVNGLTDIIEYEVVRKKRGTGYDMHVYDAAVRTLVS